MSLKAERGRHKGQSKDRERRIENKKFKKKTWLLFSSSFSVPGSGPGSEPACLPWGE